MSLYISTHKIYGIRLQLSNKLSENKFEIYEICNFKHREESCPSNYRTRPITQHNENLFPMRSSDFQLAK